MSQAPHDGGDPPQTPPATVPSKPDASWVRPPTLDEVRARLRPRIAELPEILSQWASQEGPLAEVPLLDPGMVAPRVFDSIAGTVRVASASRELITVAGLLELPTGGVLATAVTVCPDDLSVPPDTVASRRVLAENGARSPAMLVEAMALISAVEPDGQGPAAGVGIVRPLVLADPAGFPHPDDSVTYGPELMEAVADALADDREVVADLAGSPLTPLAPELARIWAPLFSVARAATVGLAARGAGEDSGN